MEITVGLKGEASMLVERADTALEVGSGSLLVYATPCMAALMEGAACEALEGLLSEECTTVGTGALYFPFVRHAGRYGGQSGSGSDRCRR